jgi:solute carrier family 45 protein 1/2/4
MSDTPPPPPRQKGVSFRDRRTSLNESSPLLLPRTSGEIYGAAKVISPLGVSDDDMWDEEAEQETKSSWYLFLLTLGGLGLQIGWSVETSYGSPYLLSLGVSKSLLALVWIAGPLSGVLVQPYVGLKSDNCRIRFGRRRPFIIGGAAATIVSLMILAWVREIIGGFLGIFGASSESQWVKDAVLLFAVLFVYVLDFAINVSKCYLLS